jgi:N-hydroxyarylamine O-acetyltransferase
MGSNRRHGFDQYCERIGLSPDRRSHTGWDLLVELQHRHLLSVPFTNLFVRDGRGTSLDPAVTVPRIAAGGGGLCYDLNGAFAWLLREFGFDVTYCSARPHHEDGSYGSEFDHLTLLVDGYIIDVGFGDFARQPIPLTGEIRTDISGTYRVAEIDDEYTIESQTDSGWQIKYRFETTPRTPEDFGEMIAYHSESPHSPFTGDSLATLPTENGRVTLSGTSITTTEHGKRRKEQVSSGKVNYPTLPLA